MDGVCALLPVVWAQGRVAGLLCVRQQACAVMRAAPLWGGSTRHTVHMGVPVLVQGCQLAAFCKCQVWQRQCTGCQAHMLSTYAGSCCQAPSGKRERPEAGACSEGCTPDMPLTMSEPGALNGSVCRMMPTMRWRPWAAAQRGCGARWAAASLLPWLQ